MKIGVYLSNIKDTSGGSKVFEDTIASAILATNSKHTFHFFIRREDGDYPIKIKNFTNLFDISPKIDLPKKLLNFFGCYKNSFWDFRLNEAVKKTAVDFMWFIGGYEPVNIPYILTIFDIQHRLQPEFPELRQPPWGWDQREAFYNDCISKASLIISGTKQGSSEIINAYGYNPDRTVVIPFPVPKIVDVVSTKPSQKPIEKLKSNYFFYPSQFWAHKNHNTLLEAFKIFNSKEENKFSLVLCGSDHGNKNYIVRRIRELNLDDTVLVFPFVTKGELKWFYENSKALIYPTFFGPDNLPPLEAFSLGCPVIASEVPGSREQLEDAAYFFNPEKVEELLSAMSAVTGDNSIQKKLIEKGFEICRKRTPEDYVIRAISEFEFLPSRLQNWERV